MIPRYAFLSALILCGARCVFGQPGTLDPSFGIGGMLALTPSTISSGHNATCVAILPDGRIVAGGTLYFTSADPDFAALRLWPDGSIDSTFSSTSYPGWFWSSFGNNDDLCTGMTIAADGTILLAGTTEYSSPQSDFGLVQVAPPDGDTHVTWALGGFMGPYAGAHAVLEQPDEKMVVAGFSSGVPGNYFTLVRYLTNGGLDPSFDGDGRVLTSEFIGGPAEARALALQPDGKILMAGSAQYGGDFFVLFRYLPNGQLDTTFSSDGKVTVSLGGTEAKLGGMALQPDGRILIAGTVDDHGEVLRYLPDGTIDSTFANNGVLSSLSPNDHACTGVVLQPDGDILLSGQLDDAFMAVRLKPDGTFDASFGSNGIASAVFAGASFAEDLTLQPDGKVVLVGRTHVVGVGNIFAIARFNGDISTGLPATSSVSGDLRAYPVPAGSEILLEYDLDRADRVGCDLIDAQGRKVMVLLSAEQRGAGPHKERLDLSSVVSGSYVLVLRTGQDERSVHLVKR